jgi:hypothetical protein
MYELIVLRSPQKKPLSIKKRGLGLLSGCKSNTEIRIALCFEIAGLKYFFA